MPSKRRRSKLRHMTIDCDCHTHQIVLEYDTDNQVVDMAFWRYGWIHRFGLQARLNYIWRVLLGHSPYLDMVELDKRGAKRLADALYACFGKKK